MRPGSSIIAPAASGVYEGSSQQGRRIRAKNRSATSASSGYGTVHVPSSCFPRCHGFTGWKPGAGRTGRKSTSGSMSLAVGFENSMLRFLSDRLYRWRGP